MPATELSTQTCMDLGISGIEAVVDDVSVEVEVEVPVSVVVGKSVVGGTSGPVRCIALISGIAGILILYFLPNSSDLIC